MLGGGSGAMPHSNRLCSQSLIKIVTSSADPGPIYLERVLNLSGFNWAKLKQDSGNPVLLIQDLFQAHVTHVSNIDDLR